MGGAWNALGEESNRCWLRSISPGYKTVVGAIELAHHLQIIRLGLTQDRSKRCCSSSSCRSMHCWDDFAWVLRLDLAVLIYGGQAQFPPDW